MSFLVDLSLESGSKLVPYCPKSGCSSSAINIVGTPRSAVHRSWSTACNTFSATKLSSLFEDKKAFFLPHSSLAAETKESFFTPSKSEVGRDRYN